MKKICAFTLAVVLCATMIGCSSSDTSTESGSQQEKSSSSVGTSNSSKPESKPADSSQPPESDDSTAQPQSKPTDSSQPPESDDSTAQPQNKSTISLAEFEAMQDGMTYEEVCSIIGSEGELLSESGSAGSKYHTAMYTWKGEGSLGANANAMFQGDKMISKAQFGLK